MSEWTNEAPIARWPNRPHAVFISFSLQIQYSQFIHAKRTHPLPHFLQSNYQAYILRRLKAETFCNPRMSCPHWRSPSQRVISSSSAKQPRTYDPLNNWPLEQRWSALTSSTPELQQFWCNEPCYSEKAPVLLNHISTLFLKIMCIPRPHSWGRQNKVVSAYISTTVFRTRVTLAS